MTEIEINKEDMQKIFELFEYFHKKALAECPPVPSEDDYDYKDVLMHYIRAACSYLVGKMICAEPAQGFSNNDIFGLLEKISTDVVVGIAASVEGGREHDYEEFIPDFAYSLLTQHRAIYKKIIFPKIQALRALNFGVIKDMEDMRDTVRSMISLSKDNVEVDKVH